MNIASFRSAGYVLSQILTNVGDTELSEGFTEGWYYTMMFEALSEISFNSYFSEQTCDIHSWYTEGGFKSVDLPEGCFGLIEAHLFDGDEFDIGNSREVVWKKGFRRGAKKEGHTARLKADRGLPFGRRYFENSTGKPRYYGAVVNGCFELSDSCVEYPHLRLVYEGVPGKLGEAPVIPAPIVTFIHDFVSERFFRSKKNKDPNYRTRWVDAKNDLGDLGRNRGSWKQALIYLNSMSQYEKKHLKEYIASGIF